MKKSDITYIVGSVFATMTAFFYCCTRWFPIKLPRYYPLEHTWKWAKEAGVPSQKWYAMQTFAFLTAAIIAAIVYVVLKCPAFKKMELKPTVAKLLGLMASMIVVLCMAYIVYYEFRNWGIL